MMADYISAGTLYYYYCWDSNIVDWDVNPQNKEPDEHVHEKTNNLGFGPGQTQTGLYSHRSWIEPGNFGFRKRRNYTIRVAKTKALISFADTAKLICVFVFAYADCWFSHAMAQIIFQVALLLVLQHWGYDGFAQHVDTVSEFYRKKKDECLKSVEKHLKGKKYVFFLSSEMFMRNQFSLLFTNWFPCEFKCFTVAGFSLGGLF